MSSTTKKKILLKNGKHYDLILDAKTKRSIFDYLRVLTPNGRYVTVGGAMSRLFQALLLGPLISLFSKKKIIIVALKPNKDLAYMNQQFEAGNVKPILEREFKLEEIREAFELFAKGEHRGKVVIDVF